MKTAILTDFVSHDPAYSLCNVAWNQLRILAARYKDPPRLIAREGYKPPYKVPGVDVLYLDPGELGQNVVEVKPSSEAEIKSLYQQMATALKDIDIVLTHDLIFQANQWKYHVAARRLANERPDMQWLHFVHSATAWDVAGKTKKYQRELQGVFPNSTLAVFHSEEFNRKASMYGYEQDQTVIIPNPIDLTAHYHPLARLAVSTWQLWRADVILIFPARLDRGKQVDVGCEVTGLMRAQGYDARFIVVDFHSTGGDKATYRDEMRDEGVHFTSDLAGGEYHIPHDAVMQLFEYADFLVHPSRSESDPLTLPEAMWQRCGMVLNFDLPLFRLHEGSAIMGKFGSNIDVTTGMPGDTNTEYGSRTDYMRHIGEAIMYWVLYNPILANHVKVRQQRSLEAVAQNNLIPVLEGLRSK